MRRTNSYGSYLLFLAATLSLVFLFAGDGNASKVYSVISGHESCDQCHSRFRNTTNPKKGRPAIIPANKIDLLCFGCHGPGGIAKTKAHVHGTPNYVTNPIGCTSCHDPHQNSVNYLGGTNIKLIGSRLTGNAQDTLNDTGKSARITTPNSGIRDVVFESRGLDVGQPSMNSFADGDENRDGHYSGVCEVCHTRTKYHRNNPSGDHDHFVGQTCTNCHIHVNQFLALTHEITGSQDIVGSIVDATGHAWAGITLFLDLNGNGIWDEGEPIAVTDENGNFVFKNFPSKGYNVLIMPGSAIPDGYDVAITTYKNVVTITTTAQPGKVEGYFWRDVNLSGILDEGDAAIPGVTVYADLNGNNILDQEDTTVITDETGFYSLADLPHGTYAIRVSETSLPEEYTLITNNLPWQVELIPPGEIFAYNDFGYRSRLELNQDDKLKYPTRVQWSPDGGYCVTDIKTNTVFIYDNQGTLTGQLKSVSKPLGIAIDANGRFYVGNNGRSNVEIYTPGGIRQQVIGKNDILMPNDLALDRNQNLYVLDSKVKQIKIFNANGLYTGHIGGPGDGSGQFGFPVAIAISYRTVDNAEVGELFVADKQTSYIEVFDLAGNHLRTIGGPVEEQTGGGMMGMFGGMFGGGSTTTWVSEGLFNGIQSLAFDQNGMLHVLDTYLNQVQILDPVTGAYQSHYDAFLDGTVNNLQIDIDISPDGKVLMTNAATQSVDLIYTVQ